GRMRIGKQGRSGRGKLSRRAVTTASIGLGSSLALGCVRAPLEPPRLTDPTPLTKCQLAADQLNPLVTEWPASQKAQLERLTTEQTVVVAYSGCTMRLLDRCRWPGGYRFQRTSISEDTIEISSTDELYAKLPLGAVGLEAELSSAGRLVVHTTAVGQLRRFGPDEPPEGAACRGATHVIDAMSVGAFEMLRGGRATAGGGLAVGSVGAGAKRGVGEAILKRSGRRSACADTQEDPHRDCGAPLQVFLHPLAATPARAALPSESPPAATPTFRADPHPNDESPAYVGPLITAGVGLGVLGAGVGMFAASDPNGGDLSASGPCGTASSQGLCIGGIASMATGGVTMAAGFFYWVFSGLDGPSRSARREMKPAAKVRLRPFGLEGVF
ncbi:MAG: hypothetical protein AAGA56_25105, partial [Myxococcota bacterium]